MRLIKHTPSSTSPAFTPLKPIEEGQERKRTRRTPFLFRPLSCPCSSVSRPASRALSAPSGSLAGIYSAMEGRRKEGARSQLHGNSRHSHASGWTLYPAPGFNPRCSPRESRSVTEQITRPPLPQQAGPSAANRRGGRPAAAAAAELRCDGASTGPPEP